MNQFAFAINKVTVQCTVANMHRTAATMHNVEEENWQF